MNNPSNSSSPPTLRSTEWILTGALLLFLVSLVLIAKIQARRFSVDSLIAPPPVEVLIEGQVDRPGAYQIAVGTTVAEALRKAHPHRFADLSSLDLSQRINEPFRIEVKALEKLSITLEGEIEQPGPFSVPVGTRISDLKKYVTLKLTADLAFFRKRRLLKEGEILVVPLRKSELTHEKSN